jgi:hypothetical protein
MLVNNAIRLFVVKQPILKYNDSITFDIIIFGGENEFVAGFFLLAFKIT